MPSESTAAGPQEPARGPRRPFDWDALGVTLSALAVVVSVVSVAWQGRLLRAQNFASISLQIYRDFFWGYRNKEIIRAIERGTFVLAPVVPPAERDVAAGRTVFSDEDLDDYLGVMQLIEEMRERGILDDSFIETVFGSFIVQAWENPVIQRYVLQVRGRSPEAYAGLERLVARVLPPEPDPVGPYGAARNARDLKGRAAAG